MSLVNLQSKQVTFRMSQAVTICHNVNVAPYICGVAVLCTTLVSTGFLAPGPCLIARDDGAGNMRAQW